MLKATIQNVSNMELDDSRKELYGQLREETKEPREKDLEGPFPRDTQPGQRSDKVTDNCIFLFFRMGEGKILAVCTLILILLS